MTTSRTPSLELVAESPVDAFNGEFQRLQALLRQRHAKLDESAESGPGYDSVVASVFEMTSQLVDYAQAIPGLREQQQAAAAATARQERARRHKMDQDQAFVQTKAIGAGVLGVGLAVLLSDWAWNWVSGAQWAPLVLMLILGAFIVIAAPADVRDPTVRMRGSVVAAVAGGLFVVLIPGLLSWWLLILPIGASVIACLLLLLPGDVFEGTA